MGRGTRCRAWGAIDGAVDGFLTGSALAFVGASVNAIGQLGKSNAVIGKLDDLKSVGKKEHTLLNKLPNKGSPKANWKQNSGVLRQEMSKGLPIRDASAYNYSATNTGFLRAERELLKAHGWELVKGFWIPFGG